jgi:hypothetical protein
VAPNQFTPPCILTMSAVIYMILLLDLWHTETYANMVQIIVVEEYRCGTNELSTFYERAWS